VLLDATVANDVTGANLYWSTAPGVSKTSGAKIMVGSIPQAHTGLSNGTTYYYVVTALNAGGESAESTQVSATPSAVAITTDPLMSEQWHIKSTGTQSGASSTAVAGEDLNVLPVWTGVTIPGSEVLGTGIRIAVVDDGLEIGHEDLASNMAANELSYNYLTGSNDPTNASSDTTTMNGHGTAVAGIIAARGFNGIGVAGVAPRSNLVGYNFLQDSKESNKADAMTRGVAAVHISNNSWGPGGGSGDLSAASTLWHSAIDTGLTRGRGGKGTIYVFAAGNGAPEANSNYHGTANSHGIVAVGAVNDQGKKAVYSEEGANLWVSAPGGEYCDTHTITTTDRSAGVGFNTSATANVSDYLDQKYTRCMNGTSAATPGVSGAIALMLEANPNLGWRDVKIILAQTARINDATDPGWFANGGGWGFNHKYGFGVVDASAAVAVAKTWTPITGAELVQTSTAAPTNIPNPIPDATTAGSVVTPGASLSSTINVASGSTTKIEFVEITFSAANHTYAGDLEVTLTSPAGTVSRLAETHSCMDTSTPPVVAACTSPYDGWVFGSSAHLDETPAGNWILTVTDKKSGDTGTFQSWGLKFYGR
jgi:kexin